MKPIGSIFLFILFLSGCNSSKPQQQPTAAEQKQMQQDQQKAMQQDRQLTSGYGKSMKHVAPNVNGNPNDKKKTQGTNPNNNKQ